MKGERMAKRSTLGSIMRKRLSDITNSQPQPKALNHEEKPSQVSSSSEDIVKQLIMEKVTLMKLVEERNKIIELSGNELQNLRINLQKLQLQNWNLAQSNSQMLAELNLGREKLKALQHELVCKDALLKAKNKEKEGKTDTNCANNGSQVEEKVIEECLLKANEKDKSCDRNRRRGARSKSMGPSTTRQQVAEKENVENKRRCLRRRSCKEDGSLQAGSSNTTNEETCSSRNEAQPSQRSSMGRPLRKAAEKVQSYKEVPVNVKMRRKK
ncbi:putative Shugoshin-1 [Melia azedarach]|uniref:Shugoshin-1 n=1 Tax=Melia azedarach TaxID=155640 RepID=A0ACC1YMM9_MELAZ|nr:putative Shugoshin-1 [Melia azedarach]